MYKNPIRVLVESLIEIGTNLRDGKYAFSDILLDIVIILSIVACMLLAYHLVSVINNISKERKKTCMRNYMITDGACIIEYDDETGEIQKVKGSLVGFLIHYVNKKQSEERASELIREYCKYVDSNYGKNVSDVENNFGKDYKSLLLGTLGRE